MSVGTGSIKRAAKAANVTEEGKKAAAKPAGKSAGTRAAESKAVESQTVGKKAAQKSGEKYEAYGVGQELPIYLM